MLYPWYLWVRCNLIPCSSFIVFKQMSPIRRKFKKLTCFKLRSAMSFLYFQVAEKNAEEVNTQNELRVNDGLAVASLAPSVSLSLLKRIEEIAEWEFFLEFV